MGDSRPDTKIDDSDPPAEKAGLLDLEVTIDSKTPAVPKGDKDDGPKDSYMLVYFILLIHGVGVLMPWNMFINANDYFTKHKLTSKNTTDTTDYEDDTEVYRDYFLRCLGFVAQVPNVLFNGINLFVQFKSGSPSIRIVFSIIVIVIMFVLTIVFAMLESSDWPKHFFWLTMITVVIINVANGIYQNSIYGTAACLPFKYTNAVILGSNISGLVTSIIALVAAAAAPDIRTSAIYYFLTAIFILLLAFDSYFALPLLPFYRHYSEKAAKHKDVSSTDDTSYLAKYIIVIKKCWVQLLSVFFVFFVTLTCFPAVEADIKRVDPNFIVSDKFFALVICFLFFNLFAVIGSFIAEFIRTPGPKYVWIPVLLRFLFIPFFMLCNFRPEKRSMPVWFGNDYVYSMGSILMSVTSGYFSSLTMMYAPSNVEDKYKGIAGMMGAFCLILGVFCGIVFSFPVIHVIENYGDYIYVMDGDSATNSSSVGLSANDSVFGFDQMFTSTENSF